MSLESSSPVRILPFEVSWGPEVRELILGIQVGEFGVPISLKDQPDLFDIPGVYQRGFGQFWVARAEKRIVGTLALQDLGNGRTALRKMFVAAPFRGAPARVGQRLVDALLAHATERGVEEVALGTTDKMHAAHRFYERNGFQRISREALPANWPHNAVDVLFFRRVVRPGSARTREAV
ncbi:MAG: GNAT family N-acetyltransferase [Myxococcaceae bacterium]